MDPRVLNLRVGIKIGFHSFCMLWISDMEGTQSLVPEIGFTVFLYTKGFGFRMSEGNKSLVQRVVENGLDTEWNHVLVFNNNTSVRSQHMLR